MTRRCLLVLLILLAILWPSDNASATGTTLSINPARVEISMGETSDVAVLINNVSGLYGVDIVLSFEPTIVEVVDLDVDREGIQVKPGRFPHPDFLAENEVINDFGTIWYAVSQVSPRGPVSGSGTVMTIRFRGKSPGRSELQIVDATLSDSGGLEIPLEATTSGEIIVLEPAITPRQPSSTPSPLPTATLAHSPSPSATRTQPTATLEKTLTPSSTREPEILTATPPAEAYPVTTPPMVTPTDSGAYPLPTPATTQSPAETPMAGASTAASTTPAPWTAEPTMTLMATHEASRSSMAASPTKLLTDTPAKVAAVIPTLRPIRTAEAQQATQEPLIPEDLFIFLAVLLILSTGTLLFRLIRRTS